MSSIQHPHIIHIFEVFENKEKIVLVMQYASGGELYEYVSERKVLNDNEARRIFRQVATAVYYCHKNKVCHRDLKLENILLDEKGNAKIGDFGLSNVFDEKHFLNTFCGSPLYASPEIVKGTPYYGPEVDCWSLGVLLYTLVYGAMPFDGSNFKRLVKQISEANYFEPKQKSDASALIRKLLAVNPSKRATIIDICTDWWVNKGYEHSLLQVAEDLANLTPVRLDLLLALAPISPSPTSNDATVINQQKAAKKKKQIAANDLIQPLDSSTEVSTDIQTYPEEGDESEYIDDSTTEFLPADVAAALEEEYQRELLEAGQNAKRQASESFDQSMTRIPSQVAKKKKPKKANEDVPPPPPSQPLHSIENQSSGYGSQSTIISAKESKEKSKESELKPIVEPKESITKVASKEEVPTPRTANESKPQSEKDEKLEPLKPREIIVKKPEKPKQVPTVDIPESKSDNTKSEAATTIPSDASQTTPTATPLIVQNKQNETKPSTPEATISTTPPIPKDAKGKPTLEQKPSFSGRKIGKVSIPKFAESKESDKKPVPSYGSVSDVKRAFQKRSESIDKEKERVVPIFSVGDVKKAFERRTSLPTGAPLWKNAGERKPSEEVTQEAVRNEHGRSMSVVVPLTSPQKTESFAAEKKDEKLKDEEQLPEATTNKISTNDNETPKVTPVIPEEPKQELVETKLEIKTGEPEPKPKSETIDVKPEKQSVAKTNEPLKSVCEIKLTLKNKNEVPTELVAKEVKAKPERPQIPLKEAEPLSPSLANNHLKKAQESAPSTPEVSTPVSKAAPITRSYKKVTFTKDGACITETGKIISEKGADGMITRVEKKSKVTHYPSSGPSNNIKRREETFSTQSVESNYDDELQNEPSSPPMFNKPSLRRSESASSSGSTDIFDDIFDTWSGDPMFSNFSGKVRSMLQARAPFTSLLRKTNKKPRRKQRTESCERSTGETGFTGFTRMTSNPGDQESDTDNENEPFGAGGGLWRFLNAREPQSSLLERHRSLLSKHFGSDHDVFPENVFPSYGRSISRDRQGSTKSRMPHTPPTTFRLMFGPGVTSPRVITQSGRESFDSNESSEGNTTPRASASSSNRTIKPTIERRFSRETSEHRAFEGEEVTEDPSSSRRRVEQWLDMNREGIDIDETHPVSMYGTIRPRMFSKYGRAMTSRLNRDLDDSNREETGSNLSFSTTQEYQVGGNDSRYPQRSVESVEIPLTRTYSGSRPSIHMKLSFGGPSKMPVASSVSTTPITVSEMSENLEGPIELPETSSLLDQLRTHGYRNLVTQRLAGTKLSEPKYNPNENTPSGQYKRGKSVLSDCSSKELIVNGACIANLDKCHDTTECMKTNSNQSTKTSGNVDSPVAVNSNQTATHHFTAAGDRCERRKAKETFSSDASSATGASTEPVVSQMTEQRKPNLISNQSSPTLNRSVTNTPHIDSTTKETVSERILRKSFYSRFNDDRPHRSTSRTRRRFSFIDGDLFEDDYFSHFASGQYSFNTRSESVNKPVSLPPTPLVTSMMRKPPLRPSSMSFTTSDDMFQRMKAKANRIFDNMRERHQTLLDEQLSRRSIIASEFDRDAMTSIRPSRSFNRSENVNCDWLYEDEDDGRKKSLSRSNSKKYKDNENRHQKMNSDSLESAKAVRKAMQKLCQRTIDE
ncbi:serine/threonine protein kinase-like protein [Dinothrombium tinctorium]|nr:serine/threonine protein kinase-like protein [Dinothrombium tinctorium]